MHRGCIVSYENCALSHALCNGSMDRACSLSSHIAHTALRRPQVCFNLNNALTCCSEDAWAAPLDVSSGAVLARLLGVAGACRGIVAGDDLEACPAGRASSLSGLFL